MMSIKLDWQKLNKVHEEIMSRSSISGETNVVFLMIMSDHQVKKSLIKLKDFKSFLWAVSENKDYNVLALIVQDDKGRILYRHKILTAGNEEIPVGGSDHVIIHWNSLSQERKDTYIRLLESQVQAYEQ